MLELSDIRLTYPGVEDPALRGASLQVAPGEVVALVGPNGAGKSSLARVLIGSATSDEGVALLDGKPVESPVLRRACGFVRQDPESQLVSSVALDEVCFGPCNLGLSAKEVLERAREALGVCGLAGYEGRSVSTLSGGELQRLALAGVLAMRPRYLVLDEVTSQLDLEARSEVRGVLANLRSKGVGIVMITHDLEEVVLSDRVVVMGEGRVVWEGAPAELLADPELMRAACLDGSRLAGVFAALARVCGSRALFSLDPQGLCSLAADAGIASELLELLSPHENAPVWEARGTSLVLDGVTFSYDSSAPALDGFGLTALSGRVLLVAGPSGSGKSTAARVASGLLAPDDGSVLLAGEPPRPGGVGLCLQRAEDQLFCEGVLEDVSFGPRNLGVPLEEAQARAKEALRRLGIDEELFDRSPLALSGGQRRRVALAGIVALAPRAYVLDEPTVGLDAEGRRFLHRLVRELAADGAPVMVVSHDLGEWLDVADDVALVRSGRINWRGTAASLVEDPTPLSAAGLRTPLWVALRQELLLRAASKLDGAAPAGEVAAHGA